MGKVSPNGLFDISFTIDPQISFTSSTSYDEATSIIREQNDGKILFTSTPTINSLVNGVSKELIRINSNGSLDTTFNYSEGNNIIDFEIQSDGKIIAIGAGPIFMQSSKYKVIRLNADGSLDTSFSSMLFDENLTHIELQSDDKILVTHLSYYPPPNYIIVPGLQRLNPDGTLDNSFNPTQDQINYTKIQPDGKILISYYNQVASRTYLGRLNSDGTNDAAFTLNYGPTTFGIYYSFDNIFVTSQGQIIIKPFDNIFNDVVTDKIYYVLNSNGALESSFVNIDNLSIGTTASQQNCDFLLLSGYFDRIEGVKKNNIIRFNLLNSLPVIAPTGSTYQNFTTGQTLSDLVVNGQNILWYDKQNSCTTSSTYRDGNGVNSILPNSTLLIDGTTYYASQTINGFESSYRLPVKVYQTLSTNDVVFQKLKMYPNPTQNVLNITNDSIIDTVEVYNLICQKFIKITNDSKDVQIDVSGLANGIYLLKVFNDNNSKSMSFIKK